ncbi:LOG family protein YvdD [compost metagenome]
MDELFEMLTWAQLGLHQKPIAILNIDGFFDDLLLFIDTMIRKGFLKQINKELLLVANDIDTLFEKLWNYQVPKTDKWIKKGDV